MGDLPGGRLATHQRQFTHCGADYFGPMEVIIVRRREKRRGALFICLSTRAMHMKLAASLSTDFIIMALHRFMARHKRPVTMYSDRGTNFVGAAAELKNAATELHDAQERIATV